MTINVTIKNQAIRVTQRADTIRISFLETNTLQTISTGGGGGGTWGSITGTITNQADLVAYVAAQIASSTPNPTGSKLYLFNNFI